MLYVFQSKLINQWNFKNWGNVFGRAFPQKNYRFSMEAIKIEVFFIFFVSIPFIVSKLAQKNMKF